MRMKSKARWLAIVIILAGFALRLHGLSSQAIWWDEARNIVVASRPLREIPASGELDIHPPLYFFLLHLWMRLGGWHSPCTAITLDESGMPDDQPFAFFLRFLSLFFGVLSLPLCYRLGVELGGQALALVATVAFSLAPFWTFEARQIRMYTAMLAFLLASGIALWKGTREEKAWQFGAFGVIAALSLLTHYSAFWILAGWAVFLILWALRRKLRGLLLAGFAFLLALAVFSPQIPRALQQTLGYANPNLTIPPLSSFTEGLLASLGVIPAIIGALSLLGTLALVLSGLREQAFFLLTWLIIPAALYYASFFRKGGAFEPRYIAGISPALYLLAGAAALGRGKTRWAIGLAVAGLFSFGLYREMRNPSFTPEDSRALVSYLYSHTSPADVIITDAPFPLNLYWPGFRPDQKGFARAYYLFADPYTLPETLSEITGGKEHAILVHWFKSDADPRGIVRMLLEKHGELLEEASFTGYTVWKYRLPAGKIPFSLAPSPEEVGARFGDGLVLEQADWGGRDPEPVSLSPDSSVVAPGHRVWVALRWHLIRPTSENLKVAGYIRDSRGLLLSQDDRWLLNDRHLKTSFWGDLNRAWVFLSIPIPPGTPPGRYTVSIAVYGESSGKRLHLLDEAGNPAGTELRLGEIEIVRPPEAPSAADLKIPNPLRIELGSIAFLGHGGIPPELAPGQPIVIKTFWETLKPGPPESIRLSLVDGDGHPAAGWEITPANRTEREGEAWWEWTELPIPPDLPPGRYRLAAGDGTILGEIFVRGRARLFSPPAISNPLEISFGQGIVLKGYEVSWGEGRVKVTLLWHCRERIAESYTVFTHILDPDGRYLAGHDSPPDGGNAPTSSWLPGEFILDAHEIVLPPGLGSTRLILEVGLYDPSEDGMPRLPTPDGRDSVLLPLSP